MGYKVKDLKDPKFWASICAWMVPTSIAVLWSIGIGYCWSRSEIGTFIGAIAGSFAGLAGFLYIYASFDQQEKHNERQTFESILLKLIDDFRAESSRNFPTDAKKELTSYVKNFEAEIDKKRGNGFGPKTIGESYKQIFDSNGLSKIRTMQELIKSLVNILVFINQANVLNKEIYYRLVFSQLTEAEIRAYFYGYFHEGFNLDEEEKKIFRDFILRYNGKGLIKPDDLDLYETVQITVSKFKPLNFDYERRQRRV
jgi:hypothetical protein